MAELSEDTATDLLKETRGLRGDIATMADTLTKYGERLDDAEELSAANARRGRVLLLGYAIGLAMFIALVFAVVLGFQILTNQNRVTELGVCPAAAIIIGNAANSTRPPEAQTAYLQALVSLTRARQELGCTDPLIPPSVPR